MKTTLLLLALAMSGCCKSRGKSNPASKPDAAPPVQTFAVQDAMRQPRDSKVRVRGKVVGMMLPGGVELQAKRPVTAAFEPHAGLNGPVFRLDGVVVGAEVTLDCRVGGDMLYGCEVAR